MALPKYDDLFDSLLFVLDSLGGSASIPEQEAGVAKLLNLSDKDVSEIHEGNRTKFNYRLAWARHYLKRFGLIENSSRGIWSLTPKGLKTKKIDKEQIKREVVQGDREQRKKKESSERIFDDSAEQNWEEELLKTIRKISPSAFERLCQRLLRESGFVQVEVTGRPNDGGIDGRGVVRLGGILSFHVLFQCKRFKGSVSPSVIRDFRGAMAGRADKGLIVTTGTYTREARIEAQRDGATQIDLIDGEDLVDKLKTLGIGVKVQQKVIEEITIEKEYFDKL